MTQEIDMATLERQMCVVREAMADKRLDEQQLCQVMQLAEQLRTNYQDTPLYERIDVIHDLLVSVWRLTRCQRTLRQIDPRQTVRIATGVPQAGKRSGLQ